VGGFSGAAPQAGGARQGRGGFRIAILRALAAGLGRARLGSRPAWVKDEAHDLDDEAALTMIRIGAAKASSPRPCWLQSSGLPNNRPPGRRFRREWDHPQGHLGFRMPK